MLAQLARKVHDSVPPRLFAILISLWPPYLFSGIRIDHISADWRRIEVSLGLFWFNRNYVGTQFGGAIYAMCDPIFMIMFLRNLHNEYIVWDKSARVDFVSPGRTRVSGVFELSDSDLVEVRQEVAAKGKHIWHKTVEITDVNGSVVARIEKGVYLRRKERSLKGSTNE